MKKVNKRLTSTRLMQEYSRILKADGVIHLKTDSNFLYGYTKEMIKTNNQKILFDTEDLYNSNTEDKILGIQTFYEQQWLERGLNIKYIKFLCPKNKEWTESDVEIEKDEYRSYGRNRRTE
jgi:tRNA (guanine-N7-)-methyltransferase